MCLSETCLTENKSLTLLKNYNTERFDRSYEQSRKKAAGE